jgi:uncharacterized protein (TIGR00369 family)
MTSMPEKPRWRDEISEMFGYRVVEMDDGRCIAEWTPVAPFVNTAGGVWGGAVAAIVDNVCATAILSAMDPRPQHLPTVSMHVDFLRPLAPGTTYRLVGQSLRIGGRLAVADTHIEDLSGELLARATCTFSIRR